MEGDVAKHDLLWVPLTAGTNGAVIGSMLMRKRNFVAMVALWILVIQDVEKVVPGAHDPSIHLRLLFSFPLDIRSKFSGTHAVQKPIPCEQPTQMLWANAYNAIVERTHA